jgi:hypothetical protein
VRASEMGMKQALQSRLDVRRTDRNRVRFPPTLSGAGDGCDIWLGSRQCR